MNTLLTNHGAFLGASFDEYAELRAAHKAGKPIEQRCANPESWIPCENPSWGFTPDFYRIKPAFQLPPPPPGVQWHDDGWTADMLPRGFRPLYLGEQICRDDEYFAWNEGPWKKAQDGPTGDKSGKRIDKDDVKYRTTRPLVFQHTGKSWTWHKPGDPCPCTRGCRVEIVDLKGSIYDSAGEVYIPRGATSNMWEKTLGWRYAETTREVELGPMDIPPGSVIRPTGWPSDSFTNFEAVVKNGIRTIGTQWSEFCDEHGYLSWAELKSDWQINRSLAAGKWNPEAWQPCSKEL